jgi:hypothetical protein
MSSPVSSRTRSQTRSQPPDLDSSSIEATPVVDSKKYIYGQLRAKMTKRQYINSYPSVCTLNKWKTDISNHLQQSGTKFNRTFNEITSSAYRSIRNL